jgi:uncharacterized secreted protein with C-terminal beta-propeller domain
MNQMIATKGPLMRRTTIAITALMLALTSCSSATFTMSTTSRPPGGLIATGGGGVGGPGAAVNLVSGALVRFNACDDFLSHVKAEAVERVGPYGLDWYSGPQWRGDRLFAADMTMAPAVLEAGGEIAAGRADGFSTTNNQEAGVDEADMVKTDGERIVTITSNHLSVIDVTGRKPELIGSMALSPELSVRDMFLHGDKVILLGNTWGPMPYVDIGFGVDDVGMAVEGYYGGGSPIVTLTEVEISDEPAVVNTLQVDGGYISSRMIDGIARVAITGGPTGFVWAYPEGNGLRSERAAIAANKQIIEQSTIENWVPYFIVSDAAGNVVDEGPAIACDRAHHPPEFAGFNMLSILTFDLDGGLEMVDSAGVLATGETVYASTDSMYVATNGWFDMAVLEGDDIDIDREFDGARTQIHQFDTSGPSTDYVATGSVPGYLLNQFAMSEHNGDLRVASTTSPNWWGGGRATQESVVSVLRPDGAELEVIGQVDGLGKDEQIYSVRFLGDVGYVVTFRQTDPFFTIDLSDPTNPIVRGELKIPGYSAYLHPVSDTLVLGIGQDATGILGSQISLFDVTDLENPERIAKLTLGRDSDSAAEYDHRAFLLWEDTIVLPITEYGWRDGKDRFHTGAVAIEIDDGELIEVARVTHPRGDDPQMGWNSQILRSLVIGDSLYTISNLGLLESDWFDFEDLTWLDFDIR